MILHELIRVAEAILPGVPSPEGTEDPRWQAVIDIADHIESCPEEIWPFVARWGCHPQEDLRYAISTCLLEHLLEQHFDLIFPRVEQLAMKDRYFADTFLRCWKLGQSELTENSRRFDKLIASIDSKSQ